MTGLNHPDGEGAIARAAHSVGTIYTQSALSSLSIEEVSAVAPGPKWFQLYVMTDRGVAHDMLARAAARGLRGARADGRRRRRGRARARRPQPLLGAAAADLEGGGAGRRPPALVAQLHHPPAADDRERDPRLPRRGGAVGHAEWVNRQFDPTVTWDDLAMLREHWDGPLLIKGIMRPDDAVRAVEHGVEGIIVSNHGGRQLDHAQSTIEALPAIADAVAGRAELYLDSGIRRGTDIITALALGARAVLIGRPMVYGLGAAGEAGARRAFELLRGELATALALAGYPRISDLGPDAIKVAAT